MLTVGMVLDMYENSFAGRFEGWGNQVPESAYEALGCYALLK